MKHWKQKGSTEDFLYFEDLAVYNLQQLKPIQTTKASRKTEAKTHIANIYFRPVMFSLS